MEYKCSECGSVFTDKHAFCPNCGHKMVYTDEVKVEEEAIAEPIVDETKDPLPLEEEVIATENEEKLDKEEAIIATPIIEEAKSEPVEEKSAKTVVKAKVQVVNGDTKKETKPVPRRVIHALTLVSAVILIVIFLLTLLLPQFFVELTHDGENYLISFGLIDFFVYKIYYLFKGSFSFISLGFNMVAYLFLLIGIGLLITCIIDIVNSIKGLVKNTYPTLRRNETKRMGTYRDSTLSLAGFVTFTPLILYVFHIILYRLDAVTLFEYLNLWAFIPTALLFIPYVGIVITKTILYKKVK